MAKKKTNTANMFFKQIVLKIIKQNKKTNDKLEKHL